MLSSSAIGVVTTWFSALQPNYEGQLITSNCCSYYNGVIELLSIVPALAAALVSSTILIEVVIFFHRGLNTISAQN